MNVPDGCIFTGFSPAWHNRSCIYGWLLFFLNETADGSIDGIGSLELDKVRRDGDDDLLCAWDEVDHVLVVLALEDFIAVTEDDEGGHSEFLYASVCLPCGKYAMEHAVEGTLRSIKG